MKQEQDGIGDALADFQRLHELPDESRASEQTRLVSRFYDVVTRFYEFGWGPPSTSHRVGRERRSHSPSAGTTKRSARC